MSSCAKVFKEGGNGKTPFRMLAEQVLSLDATIEWVALEQAGREARWAWRDLVTGRTRAGTTTSSAQLVHPLLFMLAEGSDELDCSRRVANPRRLLFLVLGYPDIVQIVAPLGADSQVSVGISPGTDPYALGRKVISLLDRYTRRPVLD